MSLTVIAALLALSALGYGWFRSWVSPAVMYPAYWATILTGAALFPIGDHRLSPGALLVFLLGAAAFVVGSAAAAALSAGARPSGGAGWRLTHAQKRVLHAVIFVYSAILYALVPTFIAAIRAAGDALGIDDFGVAARLSLGLADRAGIPGYFQASTSAGIFLAYYAAAAYEGERRDKIALTAITIAALAMSALTFGRSPVVALLLGVVSILAVRRKIRTPTIVAAFATTVALAIALGSMLDKGPELNSGKSPALAVVENLAIYFVGGPVGFATVMEDPAYVAEPGLSLRGPQRVLAWFGSDRPIAEDVHDYVSTDLGNVYTFYLPYWFDGRWLGVLLASFAAGLIATLIYQSAVRGHLVGSAAFGLVVAAMLTSAVGDGMFATPMQWLIIGAMGLLLWGMPRPGTRSEAAQPADHQPRPA